MMQASRPMKLRPIDATGRRIRIGDIVRIVGIPDLSGMHPSARAESLPVFKHLVGKYKRVAGFDRYGHAELSFRIQRGRHQGYHSVWIEPDLVRVRRKRR